LDVDTTNDTLAVCSGCAPGTVAAVFVVEHLELVAVGAGTNVGAIEVVDAAGDFPDRWVGGKLALSVAEADRGEQLNEVADGKRRELRAARGRVRALGWSVASGGLGCGGASRFAGQSDRGGEFAGRLSRGGLALCREVTSDRREGLFERGEEGL